MCECVCVSVCESVSVFLLFGSAMQQDTRKYDRSKPELYNKCLLHVFFITEQYAGSFVTDSSIPGLSLILLYLVSCWVKSSIHFL